MVCVARYSKQCRDLLGKGCGNGQRVKLNDNKESSELVLCSSFGVDEVHAILQTSGIDVGGVMAKPSGGKSREQSSLKGLQISIHFL